MTKNINNYISLVIYGLLLSFVAVFQATFISSLPQVFSAINLSLILLIFILVFFNLKSSLMAAVILGFWADLFSFYFFGLNLIILLGAVFVSGLVLNNWLTNRSLYSFLALSVVAILTRSLMLGFLVLFSNQSQSIFFLFSTDFWLVVLRQIIWALVFVLLFFNLASSMSNKLKPFFLEKK